MMDGAPYTLPFSDSGLSQEGAGEHIWPVFGSDRSGLAGVNRYRGAWKEGKRHGEGTFEYADGSRYRGSWECGLKHGKGTYLYADGRSYFGQFDHDRMQGGPPPTISSPGKKMKAPPLDSRGPFMPFFVADLFSDGLLAGVGGEREEEVAELGRLALLFNEDITSVYRAFGGGLEPGGGGGIEKAVELMGMLDARLGMADVRREAEMVFDQEKIQVMSL